MTFCLNDLNDSPFKIGCISWFFSLFFSKLNMTEFKKSFFQTPPWSENQFSCLTYMGNYQQISMLFGHRAVLQTLQSHSVRNNYSNIWQDSWLAHSSAFHPVKRLGKIWILLKSHAHAKMKNLEDASVFFKSVWLVATSKEKKKGLDLFHDKLRKKEYVGQSLDWQLG